MKNKHYMDYFISNKIEDKIKRFEEFDFSAQNIKDLEFQNLLAKALKRSSDNWQYKKFILENIKDKVSYLNNGDEPVPLFYFYLPSSASTLKMVSEINILPPKDYDMSDLESLEKDEDEVRYGHFNSLPLFLENEYQWVFAKNNPAYYDIYQYVFEKYSLLFCSEKYQSYIEKYFPKWLESETLIPNIVEQFKNGKLEGILRDYQYDDSYPMVTSFFSSQNLKNEHIKIDSFLQKVGLDENKGFFAKNFTIAKEPVLEQLNNILQSKNLKKENKNQSIYFKTSL